MCAKVWMGDESQTRRNVQEKSCRNRVEELKKNKFVSPSARQKWGEGEAEVRRFLRGFETFFHVFFLSLSLSVSRFFLLMLSSSFVHFFCRQLSKDPKQIFYPEILRKLDEITSHEFHSRFLLLFCNWHSVFISSLSYKCWP